jgi:hypothetical protein
MKKNKENELFSFCFVVELNKVQHHDVLQINLILDVTYFLEFLHPPIYKRRRSTRCKAMLIVRMFVK